MDFGNEDFLQSLERPPNIENLSLKNIIQIVLMLCLGCWAGYNLYEDIFQGKFSLFVLFQIIVYGLLFLGFLFSFFGLFLEKNANMKTGFLLFYLGCILLIIKAICECFTSQFNFIFIIELVISLLLGFVIMKQIQHI